MKLLAKAGRDRLAIGLYGGSFNPAHEAHRRLALEALKRLGLDQVWLLVSPGNPLKDPADLAPLADRLASAQRIAGHPRLIATDIEQVLGTRYTVDTIAALQRRFPRVHFVLLMGADNLAGLARWRGWARLVRRLPIAVFDRPGYAAPALAGRAAHRLAGARHHGAANRGLPWVAAPAWIFFRSMLDPSSASAIRRRRAGRERPERRRDPARSKEPSP